LGISITGLWGSEGSGRLRLPDYVTSALEGGWLSALRTGRLYPQEYPGTESTPGTWNCRIPRKKFPVPPQGIDPGTFRLVAYCLNHYATPRLIMCDTDSHEESDHRGGRYPPKKGTCPYFLIKQPAVNKTARIFCKVVQITHMSSNRNFKCSMLDQTELKSLNNHLTKIVGLYNTRFIFGIFFILKRQNFKVARVH
jgi:hypothetical protein